MRTCSKCQRSYSDDMDYCPRDGMALVYPVSTMQAEIESSLAQRFRILRQLGRGGMGAVFLAEQVAVGNRPVALKVLLRKWLDDPEFLIRFRDEAASTGRIDHPNVVTIYESGQAEDGTPYIAMQYLEGESLRARLASRGALPAEECSAIVGQAARGLAAAHKLGIIHRDLKPDNILLTRDAEGELLVKVVDFGIAKLRESATHTLTGTVLGTPAYMSFEQASGMKSEELDARSDLYSFGVVAYEMLTGRLPFHSDTPFGYVRKHLTEEPPPLRAVKPELAASPLELVVTKALAKDREARYRTVLDFARAFADAVSQPVAASSLPGDEGSSLPATKVIRPSPADRELTPAQFAGKVAPRSGATGEGSRPMPGASTPGDVRSLAAARAMPARPRSHAVLWTSLLAAALLLPVVWYVGSRARSAREPINAMNPPSQPVAAGSQSKPCAIETATPGYFKRRGIPLLSGRDFTDSDRTRGADVVIVDSSFAQRWWPGKSPVGEKLNLPDRSGPAFVIGVVQGSEGACYYLLQPVVTY